MTKVVLVLLLALAALSTASALSPSQVLSQELPPPPVRHAAESSVTSVATNVQPTLLAVATETHAAAAASIEARAAMQMSLAMDQAVVAAASADQHVTAAGQLSAEEQALVDRMVSIPLPLEPLKPVQYVDPPTRESLATNLPAAGYSFPQKLDNALNTVVSATKSRIQSMKSQAKWQTAASKLVTELSQKKSKVAAHVTKLTKEIKGLLGKKKQIQNKQLQDKLVARLEVTHNNLKKVRRQSHSIQKNQAAMVHQKEELSHALEGIKRSLALLKGFKRARKFPSRGHGTKELDRLSQFDPDLTHEAESDEVRALQFPDAIFVEEGEEMEDLDELIQE